MKSKEFFFKENTKTNEPPTLKENDFVVLLPKCLLCIWYMVRLPKISL